MDPEAPARIDPASALGAEAEPAERLERFEFRASGAEYFRIWIVNLLLTLATLGVYSAWAKVRRLQYFHGSTSLAGSPFGYHAHPLQILKGRLIAAALFGGYYVAGTVWAWGQLVLTPVLLVAAPWMIVKSRLFQSRMTSYRNLRFDFREDYRGAYRTFLGLGFLAVLTLGLAYPYFTFARHRFVIAGSSFGQTPFVFAGRPRAFYRAYLAAALFVLLGSPAMGVVAVTLSGAFSAARQDAETLPVAAALSMMGAFLVVYLGAYSLVQASTLNAALGSSSLGPHGLRSTLRGGRLFWIHLTNLLAVVGSLGVFAPWAQVRLARYRLESLQVLARGSLEEFAAGERSRTAATGDEMGEMFDLDFGL
jgi:uncharacterized membrane protein YjgN (DUF898 family)